ncbi:MAG: DUF1778 domain-containing protein [Verrucomicrobia bacterium]|jgi:uncharacterized protein (DUF1778 family)|nr:DUF1778 domain-containing protein [Verrucomicrobiota bacterium]|tara:strand:+ start:24926 stop:25117 length:192 start_codon:yes stop_codon:yes gene_type:complete
MSLGTSKSRHSDIEAGQTHERIVLNEEESRRFVETLLAPPAKPTGRLVEALKLYRENVTERGR